MPAAAVIPAPIAYLKVAAVKKLVVGFLGKRSGGVPPRGGTVVRPSQHPVASRRPLDALG